MSRENETRTVARVAWAPLVHGLPPRQALTPEQMASRKERLANIQRAKQWRSYRPADMITRDDPPKSFAARRLGAPEFKWKLHRTAMLQNSKAVSRARGKGAVRPIKEDFRSDRAVGSRLELYEVKAPHRKLAVLHTHDFNFNTWCPAYPSPEEFWIGYPWAKDHEVFSAAHPLALARMIETRVLPPDHGEVCREAIRDAFMRENGYPRLRHTD